MRSSKQLASSTLINLSQELLQQRLTLKLLLRDKQDAISYLFMIEDAEMDQLDAIKRLKQRIAWEIRNSGTVLGLPSPQDEDEG